MSERQPDFALASAIRERGFSPRRSDIPELLRLLADDVSARDAERALAGFGKAIHEQALASFRASAPPLRGRLCRLIGRLARRDPDGELPAVLVACLNDEDMKTRRNAIIALGKLGGTEVALEALLAAWDNEERVDHKRSIAAALGKLGDERALERLNRDQSSDPELSRIKTEAILKIERTRLRGKDAGDPIAADRMFPFPITVRFYCRRGIEPVLAEEIEKRLAAARAFPIAESGSVDVVSSGPLERLYEPRTALEFGLVLPVEAGSRSAGSGAELADAVVAALTSETARALFASLGQSPIRYRLEWASAGHRRALTWQVARAVSSRFPELVNDPSRAPWQVVIHERAPGISVELVPRGIADPRFTHRKHKPPAASHPTLAAALARIAGVTAEDVVWDPFVGSGSELIECALLGSCAALYGSDVDQRALEAARANLRAAGVRAELMLGDARTVRPPGRPSLIITNPPMGRRLLERDTLDQLLRPFITRVAGALRDGGRFVWISPLPERTLRYARAEGLLPKLARAVDMGGFDAQIQVFVRPKRERGAPGSGKIPRRGSR